MLKIVPPLTEEQRKGPEDNQVYFRVEVENGGHFDTEDSAEADRIFDLTEERYPGKRAVLLQVTQSIVKFRSP